MRKKNIVIVDYKVGNTNSVLNSINSLGYSAKISNQKNDIENADILVMPGVGAFQEAMNNLYDLQLIPTLENEVLGKKKPVLGICIGMQLLADSSNENGNHKGLGWIPGSIERIKEYPNLAVPHVGWNEVIINEGPEIFFSNAAFERPHFYWDHSYRFICDDKYKLGHVKYGEEITAIVAKDNIYGVQFHPEKSQTNGLRLFRSFFNYYNLR
jgi:glutamine amidotransferase